ncbi:hypothetical protein [Saccharicrinis sp. FJH54]|uniref:hypothetical protein n=1 Tax=Saccharicrinis sp. FJH54 TaxID=3344665 RepID=UPI0035D401BC
MKKLILILVFILNISGISVYSQVNFRNGFIITNDLDTIQGKVDYRSDKRMCNLCLFKPEKGVRTVYLPGEISAYGFTGGWVFVSRKIDGKPKFLELLIKGEVSLYYYISKTEQRYFLEKGNGELAALDYKERSVYINQDSIGNDGIKYSSDNDFPRYGVVQLKGVKVGKKEVENAPLNAEDLGHYTFHSTEFRKVLLDSLSDVPKLEEQINRIERPNHHSLLKLIEAYDEIKSGEDNYMVYHNLHIKPEFILGVGWLNISLRGIQPEERLLMYSLKGYYPVSGEILYLGLGFQRTLTESRFYSYKISRIPVSLKYQYPGKIIKPQVSLGLNIYNIKSAYSYWDVWDYVPSYSVGVALTVYKGISVAYSFDADMLGNSNTSSAVLFFSYSNNIGLMVSF